MADTIAAATPLLPRCPSPPQFQTSSLVQAAFQFILHGLDKQLTDQLYSTRPPQDGSQEKNVKSVRRTS